MAVDAHKAGLAMMCRTLSRAQKSTLLAAKVRDARIVYATKGDQSMNALQRRGLASFHSQVGQKYGRSYWWITDKGMEQAEQLAALPSDHTTKP